MNWMKNESVKLKRIRSFLEFASISVSLKPTNLGSDELLNNMQHLERPG